MQDLIEQLAKEEWRPGREDEKSKNQKCIVTAFDSDNMGSCIRCAKCRDGLCGSIFLYIDQILCRRSSIDTLYLFV